MRRHRTATVLAVFLLLGIVLSGCSSKKAYIDATLGDRIQWPGEPEKPVVLYQWSLQKVGMYGEAGSFLEFLLGESDMPGNDPRNSSILLRPFGVFVDDDKRIYVTDTGAARVTVVDMKTMESFSFFETPDGDLSMPMSVVADSTGRIFVSDAILAKVYAFDKRGKYLFALRGEFERPTGMAIDVANDRLYITDSAAHVVYVYRTDGEFVSLIGGRGDDPGKFNFPSHLFVDRLGRLYVTDAMNFRVQIFDPNGTYLDSFGTLGELYGNLDKPKGVAVDTEGHVFVVDSIKDMVKIFDRSGKLLLFFGEKGNERGQFWLPSGIFVDKENMVYVADTYNMRVSAFRFIGRENGDAASGEAKPHGFK